jgi:arsenite-transporting ATPase
VVQWSGIAEELLAMSKNIKRVAALLADPQACEFVAVAIPEVMSLEETVRLTGSLKRLKVPMRRLLINNLVPIEAATGCGFCSARRRGQEKMIEAFQSKLGKRLELLVAPQLPHEIRGRARLRRYFQSWQPLAAVRSDESTKAKQNS